MHEVKLDTFDAILRLIPKINPFDISNSKDLSLKSNIKL